MSAAYDYSVLFESEDGIADTWREIYDNNLSLPANLLSILKRTVYLPYDFYDIITAYFLLPSALCRTIPYLFFYGQSGSGKSTVAKIASYLYGCPINSSSDTFAGIRNDLGKRRNGWAEVIDKDDPTRTWNKAVERNICMVWDDVDAGVFTRSPDLYRLFKFGSNRASDKILVSSSDTGVNLEFHCFCPKVFSSITPLHLDDRFRELKRRLIVIPCKRVEELSDERKTELGIKDNGWEKNLIDLDAYSWKGFNEIFNSFWDVEQAGIFITTRKVLSQTVSGLGSQRRQISLDLLATGIASGVWEDEIEAVERLKAYWDWFREETEKSAGLSNLLKDLISQETKNAKNGGRPLAIYTAKLRHQINAWVEQGFLYEKPNPKSVKELMLDLGMRHQQGKWIKG